MIKNGCRLGLCLLLAVALGVPRAAAQGLNFGAVTVATGREAFVGQPSNRYAPGMVYVYRPDAQGVWREVLRLTASDSALGDGFGRSLAVDGGTLLVGAGRDGAPGVVYVFQRGEGGEWREAARLSAREGAAEGEFGAALALSGNLALIGAPGADSARGAVHVFRRSGAAGWSEHGTIRAEGVEPGAAFGSALSLAGDLLLVGARGADSGTGTAYVFRRDTAGNWMQEAELASEELSPESALGAMVALHEGAAFVGAPNANGGTGAVAVFRADTSSGEWELATTLLPFDAGRQTLFGTDIAFVGGEVWVGAPAADRLEGRIYRLQQDSAGNWTSVTKLGFDSAGARLTFGWTFDVAGDHAVVGMPFADGQEGRAAFMSRGRQGRWQVASDVAGESFRPSAVVGEPVNCAGGKATIFECGNVNLLSFMPVDAIGGERGIGLNDIWGWTDPETGREFALVGRTDGTAFVDVTDPANPIYVGELPKTEESPVSTWRDIKVYKNHAFIVADGAEDHGMQVFDLTRLRDVTDAPVTFTEDVHYDPINSAHNIVIDTATGYAFLVGGSSGGETCGGGLHMVDIRQPKQPTFAGCFADSATGRAGTGYVHDAQCVVYHGPDERYQGREICFSAAETALGIADVTDKDNPKAISRAAYPNVGYSHQGWLTEDHRYFYMDDELDELQGKVNGTRTIIWDVSRLDDPVVVGEYISENRSSDHNLYIRGNRVYQSNYQSGLRILDISDRLQPKLVGYFDTVPIGEDEPGFGGSWSNYPFFKSGTIVVTSGDEGLFMVKDQPATLTP